MDLIELSDKRELLKEEIHKLHKKLFELENELMETEKELASFSENIILDNLQKSKQQEDIINASEEQILVVACPGSGKTHTLICKYINLILTKQYLPEEVLLITFTKKAGMEIMHRLTKYLPNKVPYYVGSLHGLGYKVLQEYNDINYTVLDDKDTREYLRDLIDSMELDIDNISLVKSKINYLIDQASITYPFDLKSVIKKLGLDKYTKQILNIYKAYQQKKKKENILDFNDLMLQFCQFLDNDKSKPFKDKIKYVFFDEYQDVNPIQNDILLKLSVNSKIMVVGDDAQSIYAFRGSSVKYILNFDNTFNDSNKSKKMYLLSENYRSTPSIVDFCQDIISHNTQQYTKEVISKQDKHGFKPCILSFKSKNEEYKWVINDIIKKNKEGVKFSNMVILARKNSLLDEIELHLISNKIPVIKHLGLSLLDKSHIKDFLAFVIILTNIKSSLHWKRVISLHPNFGIKKANQILDSGIDILGALKKFELIELHDNYMAIQRIKKELDKAKAIVVYLEKLWELKKYTNIEEKIADIYKLLNYLKDGSLTQFINDLYLNQEVETNLDNVLYLTTVHGSKGLEWEYVYIINMDSQNFPSIKPKYYLDELEEMDEERRLFYVAASRAKKYLYLTYTEDLNPSSLIYPSPLIREIKSELYTGCGVQINKFLPTLIISKDVNNYLRFIGYDKISEHIIKLLNNRSVVNRGIDIEHLTNKILIGNFMDYLIAKIVQINFPKKIKNFDLNLIHNDTKFPQKIYLEYIDPQNDWRNILEHIFYISSYRYQKQDLTLYQDFLLSESSFNYYLEVEKGICKIINGLKPKEIYTHYVLSFGSVKGEIDILCDNTIIEIKSSNYEVATLANISQVLLYSYLYLKKKEEKINKIIIYNPFNGEVNNIDTSDFDPIKFKKAIYH